VGKGTQVIANQSESVKTAKVRHVGTGTNPRAWFTAYITGVPESGYEVRAPDVSEAHFVLTRAG